MSRRASGRSRSLTAQRPLSPEPMVPLPAVHVRAAVWHPLIYRKRLGAIDPEAQPGDLVAVYHTPDGQPDTLLGYGLYNPRSEIGVRIVRFGAEPPNDAYWDDQLARAVRLRRDLLQLDQVTDAYRLLHAESDGLPGFVVDRYGDTLSAEAFSLGMFQRGEAILTRLAALCGTKHHVLRPSPFLLPQEGASPDPLASPELPRTATIQEFGTRFRVPFEGGHKTGFFCDQRDNRRQLASFCRGRSVLDLCCYTGGFAVQAKRLGEAEEVIGVDLDEQPLAIARENAAINRVKVKFVQSDVFPYMRDMLRLGRQFDVVILDPPKLIRSRTEVEEGTRKHFDLNRLAMQLVRPGGLMLSCTCSGLLPQADFVRLLYSAARQAGPPVPGEPADPNEPRRRLPRTLQVLAKTGAAADHPVGSHCPETEYLQAVWMCLG